MPEIIHANKTTTAFALDGVAIKLETRFLPGESFVVSEHGDPLQVAVWATLRPMSTLSIIAAPFGTKPPTENVPPAAPGIEEEYYAGFDEAREKPDLGGLQILARSKDGPTITIFAKPVQGRVVLSRTDFGDDIDSPPTLTIEWVGEAGQRLWIVRATQEMAPGTRSLDNVALFLNSFAETVLSSDTLDQASTLRITSDSSLRPFASLVPPRRKRRNADTDDVAVAGVAGAALTAASDHLPAPSWWNGVCNLENFRPEVGRASASLGASFRGVVACGPIPGKTGDRVVLFPDVNGNISANSHGEFEFQCVEVCMRFMQLAYGITAYPGNGSQVVPHFAKFSKMKDRDKMETIPNGHFHPAPVAGDILSYGSQSTDGHTSVCIDSNVDNEGNGTITVMEQNSSPTGKRVLNVRRWFVEAGIPVTSFLHFKGTPKVQPPFDPTPVLFPETGQFVGGGFKEIWFRPENGIFLCGYPLTGEQAEGNLTVQYFENVKMEFRPGIQPRFGPVGKAFVELPNSNLGPSTEPTGPGIRTFANGHSVGREFLLLFNKYGQGVCGEPVTGEITEGDLTVQYFANVRMERGQSLPARFGSVGRQFLQRTGVIG